MYKIWILYFNFHFQAHVVLVTADGNVSTVVNVDPPNDVEKSEEGLSKLR